MFVCVCAIWDPDEKIEQRIWRNVLLFFLPDSTTPREFVSYMSSRMCPPSAIVGILDFWLLFYFFLSRRTIVPFLFHLPSVFLFFFPKSFTSTPQLKTTYRISLYAELCVTPQPRARTKGVSRLRAKKLPEEITGQNALRE